MKLKFIITGALALCLSATHAQEKLDTTTISSSRISTKYKETGKTVTVVTAKQIEAMPINSVEELLQDVAGVNLNSRSAFNVQSDIGIRGSSYNQVLILIDNQRLNDGLTGHFNNNIPIALSEIEQIEIIKGPSSVSYGSDAVGGTIHIKTKTYMAESRRLKVRFSGKASWGQHKLGNHDMSLFVNNKKYAFSGAVKSIKSDGQEFANPNYPNTSGDSTYNTYFDIKNYTLSGAIFKKNFKVYARGAVDMRDFNAKYFYTANPYDESVEQVQAYWAQAAAIYRTSKQTTEFNIGYKNNTDTFDFNSGIGVAKNGHRTTRLNATLTQNRKRGTTRFAYGLQYDAQDIVSNNRGDHSDYSIAAFGQSRLNFDDKLLVMIGARVEQHDKIGLIFVPQVTGTYVMDKLTLRTSMGQAVRNGNYTERFNNYTSALIGANRSVGNPDLQPEKSTSADLSADWRPSKKWRVVPAVFFRTSTDLIDYAQTSGKDITNLENVADTNNYFYASNVSESSTFGVELSTNYTAYETDTSYLKFFLDYTYLDTKIPDDLVSKYIANHLIHSVSPRVQFRHNRIRAFVSGNYITRNPEKIESIMGEVKDAYFLLNARVEFKPPVFPARVFIEGRNVLNTQYQEILGARMPNRWIYGGIVWRWGDLKTI